jgi:ribosome-binding factor A
MKKRQLQVSSKIQHDLASILPSVIQWDTFLQKSRFHITKIEVSSDLCLAKVFVHFEQEKDNDLVKRLKELAPLVQKKMAPLSTGRRVPRFHFVIDAQAEKEKVLKDLFHSIQKDIFPASI